MSDAAVKMKSLTRMLSGSAHVWRDLGAGRHLRPLHTLPFISGAG